MTPQTIALLLSQGKATKRGRPATRPMLFSRKTEMQYAKELLAISDICKADGQVIFDMLKNSGIFVGDAAIGDAPWWAAKAANIATGTNDKVRGIAGQVVSKIVLGQAGSTQEQLAIKLKNVSGIDVSNMMRYDVDFKRVVDSAIMVNVALVESLPKQYHEKLEGIILRNLQQNKGLDWVETEIKKLGDITDNRARLIARDQTSSINAAVNKARQLQMGIEKYTWETRGDSRVRVSHAEKRGLRYSWDNPSSISHPGEPICCRCNAEPYIE